ncbi:hypothetical protein [Celeribacter indicus]|uniref:hypothetical protein n=1 Tax=Celeribacter indicus TaxID=1208324 RepID=UPI001114C080|nr:hypothetical protein [Celeribacter indicus]
MAGTTTIAHLDFQVITVSPAPASFLNGEARRRWSRQTSPTASPDEAISPADQKSNVALEPPACDFDANAGN